MTTRTDVCRDLYKSSSKFVSKQSRDSGMSRHLNSVLADVTVPSATKHSGMRFR